MLHLQLPFVIPSPLCFSFLLIYNPPLLYSEYAVCLYDRWRWRALVVVPKCLLQNIPIDKCSTLYQ